MHLVRCRDLEGMDKVRVSFPELIQNCFGAYSNTGKHVASINIPGHVCLAVALALINHKGHCCTLQEKELVQEFVLVEYKSLFWIHVVRSLMFFFEYYKIRNEIMPKSCISSRDALPIQLFYTDT